MNRAEADCNAVPGIDRSNAQCQVDQFRFAGLRVPAGEIEQLVTRQLRRWLLDAGSMYRAASTQLPDPSAQRELVARAADTAKSWPQCR